MSYKAHCIGCDKDTEWSEGECNLCGQGPYSYLDPIQLEKQNQALNAEIALLREQRDMLLATCEAVIKLPVWEGGLVITAPVMKMLMEAVEKCEGAK